MWTHHLLSITNFFFYKQIKFYWWLYYEGVDRGYPIPTSLPFPPTSLPLSPTALPLQPHFPPPVRFFPPSDKILFLFMNLSVAKNKN